MVSEPFDKHIAVLKREVFETITPVLKHTHLILSHIRNDIEPDKLMSVQDQEYSCFCLTSLSTGGIDAYEAASEEWDNVMQDQLVEYTTAVEESQKRIKTLVAELQALEERREQWWVRCKALIEQAGQFVNQNRMAFLYRLCIFFLFPFVDDTSFVCVNQPLAQRQQLWKTRMRLKKSLLFQTERSNPWFPMEASPKRANLKQK